MSAGLKKFVAINLRQLSASGKFAAGEEVTLELLRERNLLNVSGRERDMPLKASVSCASARRVTGAHLAGGLLHLMPSRTCPRSTLAYLITC